ncbi:hypothetical protein FB645_002037 [Coemansia sp. IMI 203386]|nr:hypothetical protein FB645_002037 [Coemansia sp. IMI 203386]
MRFIKSNLSTLTVLSVVALSTSYVFAQEQVQEDVVQENVQDIQPINQGNTTLDYVSCPTDGEIKCVDDFNFMVCENSYWRASRKCADGTFCKDNLCVHDDYVPSSVIYGANEEVVNGGNEVVDGGDGVVDGGDGVGGDGANGEQNPECVDAECETVTITSCDDESPTDTLTDCDESPAENGDAGASDSDSDSQSDSENAQNSDGANAEGAGTDGLDEFQGLNADSDTGAANSIMAGNGLGAFVSLAAAVVISAVLPFA